MLGQSMCVSRVEACEVLQRRVTSRDLRVESKIDKN